jgi:glycosyltransferase involved in cell wall biosynthesis
MNLCMVLAGRDFPPDVRVEKEARALRDAGHAVVILCDQVSSPGVEDTWEGCTVLRLPREGRLARGAGKLSGMLRQHHYPRWERFIDDAVRRFGSHALHVHDLPMVQTALRVGRRRGIPVVADLHENYPVAMHASRERLRQPLRGVLEWVDRRADWDGYELRAARAVDHVVVVVEEARQRLMEQGISADHVTVVENTEDLDHFRGIPLDPELLGRWKGDFVISYIGGFGGKHRGLDTAIEAMPAILRSIPNARLLLVGEGSIRPVLEGMVAERGLEPRVTILPWQPFAAVPSLMQASDVCLVPHASNAHTEATSPHKLFQYMSLGKPVVVSTCKPLRRVIEETGGGLVFEAGNADALAASVVSLADEERRHALGDAGRRAVEAHYNWAATSRILLALYDRLVPR